MILKIERLIAFRYLKPKKKEGFLKVISIFSFTGIALGVAILIIVMSVMNGFRTELINKILGFNPHIIIKPYLFHSRIILIGIKRQTNLTQFYLKSIKEKGGFFRSKKPLTQNQYLA